MARTRKESIKESVTSPASDERFRKAFPWFGEHYVPKLGDLFKNGAGTMAICLSEPFDYRPDDGLNYTGKCILVYNFETKEIRHWVTDYRFYEKIS